MTHLQMKEAMDIQYDYIITLATICSFKYYIDIVSIIADLKININWFLVHDQDFVILE
jgi:hypothetical protein